MSSLRGYFCASSLAFVSISPAARFSNSTTAARLLPAGTRKPGMRLAFSLISSVFQCSEGAKVGRAWTEALTRATSSTPVEVSMCLCNLCFSYVNRTSVVSMETLGMSGESAISDACRVSAI